MKMRCIHINIRQATFILLTFLANNIQTADNTIKSFGEVKKNTNISDEIKDVSTQLKWIPHPAQTFSNTLIFVQGNAKSDFKTYDKIKYLLDTVNTICQFSILDEDENDRRFFKDEHSLTPLADSLVKCPLNMECKDLPVECLECELNGNCVYGREMTTNCHTKSQVKCHGLKEFHKKYLCRYCYQTEHWEHSCELKATCDSVASPKDIYVTNCTVNNETLCLGHRTFNKKIKCNWTGGYRWSTALALSITLGGFGADRFYLGHWQEGIGKLFSFGGLGVWTIIDVILISLHYLGPADGSLYL